ncbi:MAG: hypothetical protein Q9163_003145 [Psora crenata]
MITLVAFDLDGTLALSKQPLEDSMGEALADLLDVAQVAVISGGDWPQFEKQIARRLPARANRQITFSALGQQAPIQKKEHWDPDFAKRKVIQKDLRERLPHMSINIGGATSIDITQKGVDKAYGLRRLRDQSQIPLEQMMFIGDAIFLGGNDYPALELGLKTVPVKNPDGTLAAIAGIVACLGKYIREALAAGKHVLSEKPIAQNLKDTLELIAWYRENFNGGQVTWSVAENFRYLNSFRYAGEQVRGAGRVLGFRVKAFTMLKPGGKYIETDWRKNPSHQGGFLLDGGVHYAAALRLLLGPENTIKQLSAYSSQLQRHLPPVDTIDAILKTRHGATGTMSVSFGTTFSGSEYAIACESGSIRVSMSTVTTLFNGEKRKVDVEGEGSGVVTEVRDWAEAVIAGQCNDRQSPEEALADLELLFVQYDIKLARVHKVQFMELATRQGWTKMSMKLQVRGEVRYIGSGDIVELAAHFDIDPLGYHYVELRFSDERDTDNDDDANDDSDINDDSVAMFKLPYCAAIYLATNPRYVW